MGKTKAQLVEELEKLQARLDALENSGGRRSPAEEALESNALLLDAIVQAFIAIRLDGTITYWNRFAEELYGWPASEAIGRKAAEIIIPDVSQEQAAEISSHLRQGQSWSGEIRVQRRDGTIFPASVVGSPVYDESGELVGIVGVSTDITERKQTEAKLRESEQTLQTLFNTMTEGIALNRIIYNEDGEMVDYRILKVNPAFYSTADFAGKDVVGSLATRLYGLSSDFIRSFWQEHRRTDEITYSEMWSPLNDRCFFIATSPFVDDTFVTSFFDITERKQAEEALSQSEEKFRKVFHASPFAITISRLDTGEFVDVNHAFERIFGYTRQEVIGRTVFDINIWKDVKERERLLAELLANGTVEAKEVGFVRKSDQIAVTDTSFLLMNIDGEAYSIAISADITGRRRAEEALRASEEKFRRIFHTIPDSLSITRVSDGRYIDVNEGFLKTTGHQRSEVVGKTVYDIGIWADPAEREPFIRQLRQNGLLEDIEFQARYHDGSIHTVLQSSSLLMVDGEECVLTAGKDIQGRIEAEEALSQYAAQLESLRQITLSITSQLDLDVLLEALIKNALKLLHARSGGIYLYRPERDVIEWTVRVGPGMAPLGAELKRGEGLSGKVWQSGQPLKVDDYDNWEGRADAYSGHHWKSVLGVPIRWGTEFLGVLDVNDPATQTFSDEDARLLSLLADQAAVAVHNARLYERVRAGQEHLRALSAQLADAETIEQQRLARELHDRVGQNLTALGLNLNLVRTNLPAGATDFVLNRIADSLELVEQTTEFIRDVMANLRPPLLDDYGLAAALRWHVERFEARTGISVQVIGEDRTPRLDTRLEDTLFRIAREALNNVSKHARASQVTVTFEGNDKQVRLVIADNGVGFDPRKRDSVADKDRGWGLAIMSERAEAIGGRLHIDSQPGQGTQIIIEVKR